MIKSISILGSTGSIGTQSLDVVRELGIKVSALAAYKNIKLLESQIREFKPKVVAVYDNQAADALRKNVCDMSINILDGMEGLCEVASVDDADMVLNAVVGMVGLKPTLSAIRAKKDIALANKETLVAGGALVMSEAKKNNVKILPVDSEHSAIFQCLQGCKSKDMVKKLILTASGGPFFGRTTRELKNITPAHALKHPNWNMGAKITIDSATMMNKGLEIIEAAWLFDMSPSDIDVVVHRESIVHSLVQYKDNSVIAQLGVPDMRIPIQYAITWPERHKSPVKELDLTEICSLSFFKPDYKTFECLSVCMEAIKTGGLAPAAANGANEEAVKMFLNGKISFLDIGKLVKGAVQNQPYKEVTTLDDILSADNMARKYVIDSVK